MSSAERGGSVDDSEAALTRAEREGAAPGTEAFPRPVIESSPLGTRHSRAHPAMLALAAACVAIAAWHGSAAAHVHVKAWLGQKLLERAWRAAAQGRTPARPWPWADTHPVARLVVPDLDINVLVLAGANGRTLAWGPGHAERTPRPGMPGTSVITGHRDTHFAFLRDLAPGTRIGVETPAGERRDYRVERALVADHRALRLPAGEHEPVLALVTCYPFDAVDAGTPLRYAVIARAAPAPPQPIAQLKRSVSPSMPSVP